ncbi:MAG: hypothetical protein EA427_07190 [Spirochaetaceae bacterium]|nr:MAG: hypothetical protein EA427_07190 [Spirochaetaceae bacterium]
MIARFPFYYLLLLLLGPVAFLPADTRPHWIPMGSVSRELEQHALHHREFLQNRSGEIQRAGLRAIRSDLDRFERADMRIALVPIVVDMLGMEYRILSVSSGYQVDSPTRAEALLLLADLGGGQARLQLRQSVGIDEDPSVRATAASLLAREPWADPDDDLLAVSRALLRATRRGGPEAEVARLLSAAHTLSGNAWNREIPELLEALGSIAGGNYPSSLRRKAFSILEELARR